MSHAQFEYEVMRELEEQEYAQRKRDEQFVRELSAKWPGVLLWPGKKSIGQSAPVTPTFQESESWDL